MNPTLLVVLVAAAVPVALLLLRYAPYLFTRERKVRPGDVLAMGDAMAQGLASGMRRGELAGAGKTEQERWQAAAAALSPEALAAAERGSSWARTDD